MTYNFRARAQAAQQERDQAERRMKRIFWIGLLVPAIACTVAALLIGPDSWLGWVAVVAVAPAAAAGVAVTLMVQDRMAARR